MRARILLIAAASLACIASAPVAAPPPQGSAAATDTHFPLPSAPLVVHVEQDPGYTLERLLVAYSRVTGHSVTTTDDIRGWLRNASCGVLTDVEVPPARVQSFVESILAQQGLVLTELSRTEPRTLGIHQPRQGMVQVLDLCVDVPVAEIERYADHAALMVQTVVPVEWPSGPLSESFRRLVRDDNSSMILPMGHGNSVLVRGRGAWVARAVALIRATDAGERAAMERHQKDQ